MTQDEYEALIAQGLDPDDINRPGGMNLGGLPNVGGGPPGNRNKLQRDAVRNIQQGPQNAPEAPQQAAGGAFDMQPYSGGPTRYDAIRDRLSPDAQRRTASLMADKATDALRMENYSRVIQSREAKAQQHERDLMAMQQDAMLQRLAVEQQERERDRILQKQLTTGITTSQFNGGWRDV